MGDRMIVSYRLGLLCVDMGSLGTVRQQQASISALHTVTSHVRWLAQCALGYRTGGCKQSDGSDKDPYPRRANQRTCLLTVALRMALGM